MTRREHERIVAEITERYESELRACRRISLQQFAEMLGRPEKSVQVALSRDKKLKAMLGAEITRWTFNAHAAEEYAKNRSPGRPLGGDAT